MPRRSSSKTFRVVKARNSLRAHSRRISRAKSLVLPFPNAHRNTERSRKRHAFRGASIHRLNSDCIFLKRLIDQFLQLFVGNLDRFHAQPVFEKLDALLVDILVTQPRPQGKKNLYRN